MSLTCPSLTAWLSVAGKSPGPIGVLALQGDFREHRQILDAIGVESIEVRTIADLSRSAGLIIPGGESTVMQKLAVTYGLFRPIQDALKAGLPVFGTCAGLIMLATEILDGIPSQYGFAGIDVSVRRNAFGNQLDSFEVDLDFKGIPAPAVHAAFIRAPIVERIGDNVEVLSKLDDGRIVAVRQGSIMGIAFHPEITGETRIHELFVSMTQG